MTQVPSTKYVEDIFRKIQIIWPPLVNTILVFMHEHIFYTCVYLYSPTCIRHINVILQLFTYIYIYKYIHNILPWYIYACVFTHAYTHT